MALAPGTRLGVFQLTELIGRGGMGEVYRATDTSLGRQVAIKILPEAFAQDAERLARFEREAKTLASLNHPNIAAIYAVERSGGITALVMELVEGDDLSQRIARGAIPIDDALPIAKQIAEALEAAHEQGIIHRDLKPANIKVRSDGTVKVLDFGLAKAMESPSAMSVSNSQSPTITTPALMTGAGMILGTAAYMSPEQARGKTVDKRADIWAFGAVLFEMLTGKRPFDGEDMTEVLGAVVRLEPPWETLPSDVPLPVRTLLQSCLVKDPRRRVADISTAIFVLDKAAVLAATPSTAPPMTGSMPVPRDRARTFDAVVVSPLAGALVAAAVAWYVTRPAPTSLVRLTVAPRESMPLAVTLSPDIAMSRDGQRIAYITGAGTASRLHLRPLDQLDERPLAPDSDADQPFFSPDGNWVGFVQSLRTLRKVATAGGPPETILQGQSQIRGASWGQANDVVFATDDAATGLMRIPSAGGTADVLTKPEAGKDHYFPEVLPRGRGVLFTVASTMEGTNPDTNQVAVFDFDRGEQRILIQGGSNAHYVASGHLVYAVTGMLRAVRFDLDRLEVRGDPVTVVTQVVTKASGAANFATSSDGTLVYQEGAAATLARTLVWIDRQGREEPIAAPPREYVSPFLSPDGTRIALDVRDQPADLWIWSVPRQTLTRVTFDPQNDLGGIWSPDGQRVAFSRNGDGGNLYWRAADGTGVAERLLQRPRPQRPTAFSPDGNTVLFTEPIAPPRDIGMVALTGARQAELLLHTPFDEANAEVSPDGRWLAYQSNESGRNEVYVRPFPDVNAGRWQISGGGANGSTRPLWARNGRELFYFSGVGRITAVPIRPGATFEYGAPTVIVDGLYAVATDGRNYDVSPDGRRFLMIANAGAGTGRIGSSESQLNVFLNWDQELKRLLPQ
jgi:serine/threonine-protein kinase